MDFKITFDWLPALGGFMALAGFYLPKFKTWYEALQAQTKQLFNVGVITLIAIAVWGLGFTGQVNVYPADLAGLWNVATDIIFALVINAGVYKSANYIGTGR